MLPNPFSDVGRVYNEVQDLKRELHNKVNNWEYSSLKNKIDALSQDVRTINECIMDIYNKIDAINNRIQEICQVLKEEIK